jgi:hypothetical protein
LKPFYTLLKTMKIDTIQHAIATRRTVKPERYTGEIIPDELIWKVLATQSRGVLWFLPEKKNTTFLAF